MLRDQLMGGRTTSDFTLQWHLTNACGLHCAHCYDRSLRRHLRLEQTIAVVDDLQDFCRQHRVRPHICLAGGDPLLYPHFWELYGEIASRRIRLSLLANPIAPATIERLMAAAVPGSYQVSLEGLREHNDAIRGAGHYDKTLQFLHDAQRLGMVTHVMLTLTRSNIGQVLPLAEVLRDRTRVFNFTRLAQVGEGAALELPSPVDYRMFLEDYLAAARHNPVMGLKDNLLNILRHREGRRLFGGCTGHGCGAAFDFVALLPDGEVHACRKFPSRIGRIGDQSLSAIYTSASARAYRGGPSGCGGCQLKRHCAGCMAVVYGMGLDPLKARDPFCFKSDVRRISGRRQVMHTTHDAGVALAAAIGVGDAARDHFPPAC